MEAGQQIEQWFYHYEKEITRYLVYYTGSKDVEDLVQDTFLRAYLSYERFRYDSNPKTWLISIARNSAIDYYRKRTAWKNLKEKLLKQSPIDSIQIDESIVQKSELVQLYKAINQLKANYRDVVLLRGIAELSAAETAEVLGWTTNKVNVNFYRATKKLNFLLKEAVQGDPSFR
ncbi:RNA polymerase sigma factor [Bacillus sp. FJAT-49705]|uniref:RNA polymerase sigma factor n=1 Tax=Cytobacillus citreus TaxID=2833586 RepID=A0ABS5NXV0_9BACI|nr:RNA polymerase sigma factor [Cytobacillus citreus]MBS4191719.1 RNA polymerase sigma factor [Cytobacillus citreus]